MKRFFATTAVLAFAMPAFSQTTPGADPANQVSMGEVPEAVMMTAQDNAMGLTFESVQRDPDADTETYEFLTTKEDGMHYEVDVMADGTLEETEEEVPMDMVPQEVSATLDSEAAGFEPSLIEMSTRADDGRIVYEFEGMLDGQKVDIEVNEDGSNFTQSENTAS